MSSGILRPGAHGAGAIPISMMGGGALGLPPFDFNQGDCAFIAGMAKRTAPGPFAAAPIIQGAWDGTGVPDVLSFVRGNLIGNQAGYWRDNLDPYQGGGFADWTPEQATGARTGDAYVWYASSAYYLKYDYSNDRYELTLGGQTMTVAAVLVAGTMEILAWGFDTKGSLDGANHTFFSRNNVQTFGMTTQPTATAPGATIHVGSNGTGGPSNAIPEGLVFVREIPWTGTYGTDMGVGDVVAAHYAAGSGADVALTIASWGTTFSLPTDSTPGALVTGVGEAWSHPHSSSEPKHSWLADGGYLGGAYGVLLNGTSAFGNCGSGATLDDLGAGGATFQIEVWARLDAAAAGTYTLAHKGSGLTGGWAIYVANDDKFYGYVDLATTNVQADAGGSLRDGKLHHFLFHYNDTTKTGRCAVDGVWGAADVGAGNYVTDAASNFEFGRLTSLSAYWDGTEGWCRIWGAAHYTPGTDFAPPRAFSSVGTVEAWSMADGSGATAVASITSPGCDCALTNHVWEEQWDVEGTPVIPQSVRLDGSASANINCGSGASIDNLPTGANGFTAEGWFRADGTGAYDAGSFLRKGAWDMRMSAGNLFVIVSYATASIISSSINLVDGRLHHLAVTFEDIAAGGDGRARAYLDGILVGTGAASAGAYGGDAAEDLLIGRYFDGAVGWTRLSDVIRYTDTFVPPSRINPPAVDGNTVAQYNFRDGAGTTLLDETVNNNDGTITAGIWNNTPDMEVDEPGARVFGWGYNLGADAANEGMTQIDTGLTPGDDYVLRVPISVGQSGRAQAAIRIYDEIGAAIISTLAGPKYYGVHDGGNAAADLGDSTARWWQGFVGWTCHNIEDGSNCVVTAVDGDMNGMTTPLAGGGSNDWQNGEHYLLRPPNGDAYSKHPWVETFCIELPAGCTSVSWKVLNPAGEGVLQVHQYEVQESLITNGGMEGAFAGVPPIPAGWTNDGLDAGDSQAEAGIIHSGAGSMRWNVGAVSSERIYQALNAGSGAFFAWGFWHHGDGTATLCLQVVSSAEAVLQYSASDIYISSSAVAAWSQVASVWRQAGGAVTARVQGLVVGTHYADDIYAFALDPVSLTVTPASEANSAESGGLRVDGRDACPQATLGGVPIATILQLMQGSVRWIWRSRHDAANLVDFDEAANQAYIMVLWANATNWVIVYASAANQIAMQWDDGAGPYGPVFWACGADVVADTPMLMELRWIPTALQLYSDNVLRLAFNMPILFTAPIVSVYWGSRQTVDRQGDAVFASP